MFSVENLNEIKSELAAVLESTKEEEKDPVAELEQKIEDIKKKETRGFISKEEAEEGISDLQKKLKEIKKELSEKKEDKKED